VFLAERNIVFTDVDGGGLISAIARPSERYS
jgi:hypothetical protein